MVTLDKSFEPIQNQTKLNQNQKYSQNLGFCQFFTYGDMLCI